MPTISDECGFEVTSDNLQVRTTGNNDKIIITKDLSADEAASLVYLAQQEGITLSISIKLKEP